MLFQPLIHVLEFQYFMVVKATYCYDTVFTIEAEDLLEEIQKYHSDNNKRHFR